MRSDDLGATLCGPLVIFGVVIKTRLGTNQEWCPRVEPSLGNLTQQTHEISIIISPFYQMRKLAQRSCGTFSGLYSEEAIEVEFEPRMACLRGQHSAPQALGQPVLSEGQTPPPLRRVCALSVVAQIPVTSEQLFFTAPLERQGLLDPAGGHIPVWGSLCFLELECTLFTTPQLFSGLRALCEV